ncbi:MAG: DNA polymerase III subunit chi [Gammaproteobacteria bacterium]|nr:DNA polymerase III subunit chi [Gammaproteobacteria bacterium]
MTNISFYLQQEQSTKSLEQIVSQLIYKAYQQDNFIYVQTQNAEQANLIDEMLWCIQDDTFIPHLNVSNQENVNLLDNNTEDLSLIKLTPEQQLDSDKYNFPVIINTPTKNIDINLNRKRKEELLINLDEQIPLYFSRFHRFAEIISKQETAKSQARKRYKFYKDRGYPLITHEIN